MPFEEGIGLIASLYSLYCAKARANQTENNFENAAHNEFIACEITGKYMLKTDLRK